MNKFLIFLSIILFAGTSSFAQKIIRSSLSSFGNTIDQNGTTYRQTIGQPSSTTVVSNNGTNLRQGFQQPASLFKSNSLKERECTLYLSPNPAKDVVHIRFAEEIGENQISVFDMMGKLQFKINITASDYEMDISKLSRGVYLINVISKSGYQCNQKLIVI